MVTQEKTPITTSLKVPDTTSKDWSSFKLLINIPVSLHTLVHGNDLHSVEDTDIFMIVQNYINPNPPDSNDKMITHKIITQIVCNSLHLHHFVDDCL